MRVREIIKDLKYSGLLKSEIVPKLDCSNFYSIKKYPPTIYKNKSFSDFGLFMEFAFKNLVVGDFNIESSQVCKLENILDEGCENFNLNKEEIKNYYKSFTKSVGDIVKNWKKNNIGNNLTYDYELFDEGSDITGHPDIMTESFIVDIKNTSSFKKMESDTLLQMLSYYAISRNSHKHIKKIAILLTMQKEIITFDLSEWDHTKFLNILRTKSKECNKNILGNIITGKLLLPYYGIGTHISKDDFLKQKIPKIPYQIFFSGIFGKDKSDIEKDLEKIKNKISSNELSCYIHAPYDINLCSKKVPEKLNKDLINANLCGCKGVVVHTGQYKTLDISEALNNMENNCRESLFFATKSCPLILETPCGEGTEVCYQLETLSDFYNRFNEEEKEKLFICIDTAHIHAAGYDVYEYVSSCNIPIKLVHFNDSKVEIGSHCDRHAFWGSGKINFESLRLVAEFCNVNGIDMVTE